MPRYLRFYLVACIALAFGYLVVHAGEPLRLNVGDPWTDASVVGTHHITLFRLLALLFSGLAAWLLFQYARRMWNDTVAIIATALIATSLVWMMFADGFHRPPVMHAACFLALWGVVRALETGLRRHYIAVLVGTFACLVAGPNDWLFLPLGLLFTIYVKRGSPLSRDNWGVVAVCAVGVVLAGLLRSPFAPAPGTWQSVLDHQVATTFAALGRRYTALLNPTLWITLCWAVWRVLRAGSVKSAFEDGTTWMLVAVVAFAFLPAPRPESATLRTQLLLPLYAIGSALLIARLFENGRWLRRLFAVGWCAMAPLWGLWLMFSHPHEVLDRDDLARANEYLARNDRNGFVISNLLAEGPLMAAFGRHGWPALRDPDSSGAHLRMLDLFEITGTDYAHAIIFTTPGSRFVDRSIAQVLGRRMPAADGWPYLVRDKVNDLIAAYDRQVLHSLELVGAKRVLQLSNFDIYRIDRSAILEAAARTLPVVRRIDLDNVSAFRHQLLGWGDPVEPTEGGTTNASIAGHGRCWNPIAPSTQPASNGCVVVELSNGLDVLDVGGVNGAELMVRIERVCDHQLTITFAAQARVDIWFNGAAVLSCGDPQWGTSSVTVRVPRTAVHSGLNIIRFSDAQPDPKSVRPEVKSVVLDPICEPAP